MLQASTTFLLLQSGRQGRPDLALGYILGVLVVLALLAKGLQKAFSGSTAARASAAAAAPPARSGPFKLVLGCLAVGFLGIVAMVVIGRSGSGPRSRGAVAPAPGRAPRQSPATPAVPPLASLLTEASARCEVALTEKEAPGSFAGPVLALVKRDSAKRPWQIHTLPHVEAASAAEVKTLACIRETHKEFGKYTSGDMGYVRVWDLRMVGWPQGRVVGRVRLEGGAPQPKYEPGAAYGPPPLADAARALSKGLPDRTVYFNTVAVNALAFAPDGRTLAVAGTSNRCDRGECGAGVHFENGGLALWDLRSSRAGRTLRDQKFAMDEIRSAAFTGDGSRVMTDGGRIVIWNAVTGVRVTSLQEGTKSFRRAALSPDGHRVAGTGQGGTSLWDVGAGKVTQTFPEPADPIEVTFSPDGKRLAVAGRNELHVLRLDGGGPPVRIRLSATALAFSADGAQLAAGTTGGRVEVYSESGRAIAGWQAHQKSVNDVHFSPDGKTLASAGDDQVAVTWALPSGARRKAFAGHVDAVSAVAFSPDGQTLATGSKDTTVRLWPLSE